MKRKAVIFLACLLLTSACNKDTNPVSADKSAPVKIATFQILQTGTYGTGNSQGWRGTVQNTSNVYVNVAYLKVTRATQSNSINMGSFDRNEKKSFDTGLGPTIYSLSVVTQ